MQIRWLVTVVALYVAVTVASTATAQTAEDAAKFLDEVSSNGSTELEPWLTSNTYQPAETFMPITSTTSSCSSRFVYRGRGDAIVIDWSKNVEVSAGDTGRITIVGGVYYRYVSGETENRARVIVSSGSKTMGERLLKAIGIIIKSCAKPSHGF